MERIDVEQWKGREVARLLALVETERRYYQEMVAALPVALAVLSSDNTIVSANRSFRETFHLSSDEVRRRKIDFLLPIPELLGRIKEARESSVQGPSSYLATGNRLYRVAVVPFRNWDDASEIETLLMIFDVTDVAAEQQAKAPAPEVHEAPPTPIPSAAAEVTPQSPQEKTDAEHIVTPMLQENVELEDAPAAPSAITPVVDQVVDQVVDRIVDQTVEPAVEPVVEQVTERPEPAEPAVEPTVEHTPEPVAEQVIEQKAERPAEQHPEPVSEPVSESAIARDVIEDLAPEVAQDVAPEAVPSTGAQTQPASPESAPAPAKPSPLQAEHMPAILWLAAASDLSFTHVSDSAIQMLGYAATDWTSNPRFFSQRIHLDDRDATMALYRAAIQHGQEVSAEFRVHTAAGNVIWCRETFRPLPTGAISGVLTPLGARKQMEQQRVTKERHFALQNLSAQLAHDLNNPLMIITGYAEELLHHTPSQDPRRGDLEEILGAAQRISGITSQLLSFTRRPEPATQALDLARLVRDLKPQTDAIAGPDMAYISADEPVWAMAEREPFEQIIMTLLKTVHESPSERIALVADSAIINEQIEAATLAPGTYARLTVRNDGPGMDPVKRATMFESIVTKERPTASSPTGSALAQAYALIQSWDGDITFTSDAAQGSIFTILLPLADAPAISEATASAHAAEMPHLSGGETILVVDDEPGIRALVAKILRRERYDVIEAGSASEAISVVSAHTSSVKLLLTDVMLPDRSGRQVAEELTASLPDLKVLYISGFTDDESVRAGEFPPGSRFLQKPFTVGALVGKVREALDR